MSQLREHTDRPTALRVAEIQRVHGVRLKLAYRSRRWACAVFRHPAATTCDIYNAGEQGTLADLLDHVAHDLVREPTAIGFVRRFFGVELIRTPRRGA